MKRWFVLGVVILMVAVCSSAFAKKYNHQRMTPEQRVERLTTMLDLTPDQQTKIKDIIVRRDKVMEPLFKSLSEAKDKEEQREIKMDILEQHQRFRDEMNKVLTSDQEQKYQDFIQKRIQQRRMMRKSSS